MISRAAYWDKAGLERSKHVKLRFIKANATFTLEANEMVEEVTVFNNSPATQAAITVGSAAGGTQYDAGASMNTLTTRHVKATVVQPLRTAGTVYVQSAAWQTGGGGVHVVVRIRQFPPTNAGGLGQGGLGPVA